MLLQFEVKHIIKSSAWNGKTVELIKPIEKKEKCFWGNCKQIQLNIMIYPWIKRFSLFIFRSHPTRAGKNMCGCFSFPFFPYNSSSTAALPGGSVFSLISLLSVISARPDKNIPHLQLCLQFTRRKPYFWKMNLGLRNHLFMAKMLSTWFIKPCDKYRNCTSKKKSGS